MNGEERKPTTDELLAMAWVDGELSPEDRRRFEARMEGEPALVREVAAHQRLAVLAREVAPPEPLDHEWRRLAAAPAQRVGLTLGWALIAAGGAGLATWCVWEVCCAPLGIVPKLLTGAIALGFLILFTLALRARLRTRALDPYSDVKR